MGEFGLVIEVGIWGLRYVLSEHASRSHSLTGSRFQLDNFFNFRGESALGVIAVRSRVATVQMF